MLHTRVKVLVPYVGESELSTILNVDQSYGIDIFDDRVLAFGQDFSRAILQNPALNRIPAISSLAFWLRQANLKSIEAQNQHLLTSTSFTSKPLGLVFHICPSNVDTIAFYSLFMALLGGNKSILRISDKLNDSAFESLFTIINLLLAKDEHQQLRSYITMVQYGHEEEINKAISCVVNARMIWGGDNTIAAFKQFSTLPRCRDISFADRNSFALIDSSEFLKCDLASKTKIARNFFLDAYTFDQKGCSSPKIIFTLGKREDYDTFSHEFNDLLTQITTQEYEYDSMSIAGLKLNQEAEMAIEGAIEHVQYSNKNTVFAHIEHLPKLSQFCGGGFFYVKSIQNITDILPFCDHKTQTIAYYGINATDIQLLAKASSGTGIERIVPFGKALEFNYLWDGLNLIDALTTKINIK